MDFGDVIIFIIAAITILSSALKSAKKMKRSKKMDDIKKTVYFDANGNPVTGKQKKFSKNSVLKSFMDEVKKNIEQKNSYAKKAPAKVEEPIKTVPVKQKAEKKVEEAPMVHEAYSKKKKKKKTGLDSLFSKKGVKNGIIFKEIIDTKKF